MKRTKLTECWATETFSLTTSESQGVASSDHFIIAAQPIRLRQSDYGPLPFRISRAIVKYRVFWTKGNRVFRITSLICASSKAKTLRDCGASGWESWVKLLKFQVLPLSDWKSYKQFSRLSLRKWRPTNPAITWRWMASITGNGVPFSYFKISETGFWIRLRKVVVL